MDLTLLTSPELIHLNSHFSSRERAIAFLVQQLDQQGILDNAQDFLQAVTERENEGPTALGEGLAVPHGKSASVRRAAFALVTLEKPLPWQGVDGEEPVNMIFLLAIPEAEAGSTHMELLTALTTRLVDDQTRAALLVARHVQEVLTLLGEESVPETQKLRALPDDAPRVVCITACPAGIAHTYMAAEYLEKAAKKLGIHIDVEKQGANGIENAITAAQCDRAVACVFAAEVAIKDSQRFDGIPCVQVPVAEPIRHAEAVLQQALAIRRQPGEIVASAPVKPQKTNIKADLKQALLSGISFAVPLIVAGGSLLAVTVLIAQLFGWQELYAQKESWLWMYRQLGGGMLGILMVPVLSAYTAYSLADKPALTPGFAAGLCANMIGAGFLGGVAGGLIAGYVMRWMKKHVRLRASFNGFLMFYLYPVLGTLVTGSVMLFVIGEPVAWLNTSLTAWLNGLSGSNAMVLGALIAFMCSFDLGGPINKAAYAFCLGAMANGVYGPYAIFGATKMVSAFTVTASTLLAPQLFKSFEIETGKSTWLLGLAGITEGAIPMAIEDPLRVIGSFLAGSVVTGAIVGASGIGLSTPGAGIFSMFLLHDGGWGGWLSAAIWLGAALAGTVISTVVLLSWRGYAVRQGHFTGDIPSS
jgi:2-O-A-mannosyl-D-glycerate PTS system EIIABC component